MATTPQTSFDPAAMQDFKPDYGRAYSWLFSADMPVSYRATGEVASRFGDASWDLSDMSTDGTTRFTLHFHESRSEFQSALGSLIREQQKALIWLHMDAGKLRAPRTLFNTNRALAAWCERASLRGVDLYTLLTSPQWVTEGAQELNVNYVNLTASVLRTLWRHREQLQISTAIPLQVLRQCLNQESRSRPEYQQTPLIPSRVYCSILVALDEQMSHVENEIVLLEAYRQENAPVLGSNERIPTVECNSLKANGGTALSESLKGLGHHPAKGVSIDQFIAGRLAGYQVVLMLVVAAYTGMRLGEVAILPREDVLRDFEHLGSSHFELRGPTHKLNKGVRRATSWITSHQGARAARLAQRIARLMHQRHETPTKNRQEALLFPSKANPSKRIGAADFDLRMKRLRDIICPVIEQSDVDELNQLELSRGWEREGIVVGKRWPLAFHQLRRSLAVYAHRSGMVSLPSLKAQLQHITQEMTAYYSNGFCRAVNLVFDPTHFSHEWQAAKAESSYFAYALGVLFEDEVLLGRAAERMSSTVESRSRRETLSLFEQGKLAYRDTPLGGCVSTEACKVEPLEPIPYNCLETNCVNMVVFGKRLEHVIKSQETAVAAVAREDSGSVEHRLEARHLEVLLKTRERLKNRGV